MGQSMMSKGVQFTQKAAELKMLAEAGVTAKARL